MSGFHSRIFKCAQRTRYGQKVFQDCSHSGFNRVHWSVECTLSQTACCCTGGVTRQSTAGERPIPRVFSVATQILKKVYQSAAYITHADNTVCQLILAASNTLESVEVDPSVPWFLQTALLAMGLVTCTRTGLSHCNALDCSPAGMACSGQIAGGL